MLRGLDISLVDEASVIRLPHVCVLGFTGHRRLPNEDLCRSAIRRLLAEQVAMPNRKVCAVASVAAGADLLFTEGCIEQNIPLQVLLPFSKQEFRQDFDAQTWTRAERVMDAALSVITTGNDDLRTERYYECGVETVQQAQVLVAVWNGHPANGLGGAQEIVDFATRTGKPVLWIHSETGAVQSIPGASLENGRCDPELEFLNRLPDAGIAPAGEAPGSWPRTWLAKLDANALIVAPQVRRLAAVPIVCAAFAAILSGSSSRLPAIAVWSGLGTALGITAASLPTLLRLAKRQALWVRIRTAAEVTRSVLALWDTPIRYQVVGHEILPELADMIRSLNFIKTERRHGLKMDLVEFKQKYLDERVHDQMHYFARQVQKAAAQGRKYRTISKISIGVAIVLSAWMFGARVWAHHIGAPVGWPWLALMTSALFQVATVAGALLVVHDCDRRERRYQELHKTLHTFGTELSVFRTWPPVAHLVSKIERALLLEVLEWRSLLQNREMPRN